MARRDRGGALVLAVTLVALAVTLLVHVAPWVDEGFGISHDGFNASVWALGGRGARLDPIGNRLGGVQPDGFAYANHPPLVVWTTALTSAVSDEEPFVMRLPALTASLASLLLLSRLLLDAGLRRVEVAAGLAVAGTTGMFLTFGAMLDTPVVGLPVGLAVALVAQRAWQGRAPRPIWALVVGLAAGLVAWQAAVITVMAVAVALLSPAGRRSRAVRALAAGLAAGVAVTLAWVRWVTGGLGDLLDQGGQRSGSTSAFLDRQQLYAMDLYGPAVLVVTALGVLAALAVRRRRVAAPAATGAEEGDEERARTSSWHGPRPLVAVLAAAVGLYTLAFREGATIHEYWTYWAVTVVAVGAAALVALITDGLRRAPPRMARLGYGVVVLVVVAVAITGAGRRSAADRAVREGLHSVPILARLPQATSPDQATVAARSNFGAGAPWANYATHGRAALPTKADLLTLPPETLVFLDLRPGRPRRELRAVAMAVDGPFVLVRAGDYQRIVD